MLLSDSNEIGQSGKCNTDNNQYSQISNKKGIDRQKNANYQGDNSPLFFSINKESYPD